MPQVHNKSISLSQDSSIFNKSSRYMASLSFSEASLRRVNVLNSLENRLSKVKLKYFERHAGVQNSKMERARKRIIDNLNKRMAYKLVLKNHSIENAKDYHKALDEKYTYEAFHQEVKSMMHFMRPELLRERRAKALVNANRKRYESLLQKNRDETDRLFPVKKWKAVDFSKFGKKQDDEDNESDENETKSPILTNIELRNRKSLAGLRRRVITIDESKPNSPVKTPVYANPPISPVKTPSNAKKPSSSNLISGKRQGITMSMMKTQKSFIDIQQKVTTPRGDETALNEDIVKSTPAVASTHISVGKDNNDNIVGVDKLPTRDANMKPEYLESDSKKSFLPPIRQKGLPPKADNPKPSSDSNKPVRFPVLKMNTSNSK